MTVNAPSAAWKQTVDKFTQQYLQATADTTTATTKAKSAWGATVAKAAALHHKGPSQR